MVTALFGMELAELTERMEALGQKPYRARQVFEALYKQRVGTLEEMTTLPAALREELARQGYGVGLPEMVQTAKSVDGTERYLMRMADGETVETVWMPGGDGGERGDGSERRQKRKKEGSWGCGGCGGGPNPRLRSEMWGTRQEKIRGFFAYRSE